MDNKIIIVIAILAFYFLFIKKESFAFPLDDICSQPGENCSTPEGKAKAAEKCLSLYGKQIAAIPACKSLDKDIFANGCPYNCKTEDIVFATATNEAVTTCSNSERQKKDGKNYCQNSKGIWIVAPPEINPSPASPPGSQYIRHFEY
jgi:hypothetical protein